MDLGDFLKVGDSELGTAGLYINILISSQKMGLELVSTSRECPVFIDISSLGICVDLWNDTTFTCT